MASVVDKVKAKVEHVLHKDSTHTTGAHTTGTHTTGTHTGHSTNAGPHDSNIANKADPRVDSDRDGSRNAGAASYGPGAAHSGVTGTYGGHGHSTNAGPHDSNLLNKADPRVDSDRDGSRNAGASTFGPGAAHSGPTGTYGGHGNSTNAGPHDSNLLNKADPRVDSDRDGSRNAGISNYGPGASHSGTTGTYGGHGNSTNAGPHDSNVLNKLDPRVDSDRDGSQNFGAANYGPGAHAGAHAHTGTHTTGGGLAAGTGTNATNSGPHNSNMLNKADPRVDSDRDGSRNLGAASHGAHSGTGPAHGTAGAHSSNLANKLDPRVDSDLDGSRTAGNQNSVY